MIRIIALTFLFVASLSLDNTNAQLFQGGTVTYTILDKTQDYMVVRLFHKFVQKVTRSELAKCDGNCIDGGMIEGDYITANPTGITNATYIKRIDTSYYCDVVDRKDEIVVGSRETDLVLERRFNSYDLTFPGPPSIGGCCVAGSITGLTLVHAATQFKASSSLRNRTDNKVANVAVNNIPDTRFASVFVEFKSGLVNEHVLAISDLDNDIVRCDWVSDICLVEPCAAKYTKSSFTLYPNCTIRLTARITVGYYSLGMVVRDFYRNATDYRAPLSSIPFFMLVRVSADDNSTITLAECPSDRKKPIQNQIFVNSSSTNNFTFSFYLFNIIIFLSLFKSL